MHLEFTPDSVPLAYDSYGTVRVAGTRVTLDTILGYFNQGQSPEELAYGFPTVGLSNIYTTIAYYLRHQAEVDAYLEQQEREAEAIRRKIEACQGPQPSREQLLARRAQRERAK